MRIKAKQVIQSVGVVVLEGQTGRVQRLSTQQGHVSVEWDQALGSGATFMEAVPWDQVVVVD